MTTTCKDCIAAGITSNRKSPHPGPRCTTHHRARKKLLKNASHASRIKATYDLTADEYEAIREYQGGVCAICRRATGATRRLSVDHDHSSMLVRGLLCRPCNTHLGHMRDDPAAFQRGIDYLANPPAFAVIGERKVPE